MQLYHWFVKGCPSETFIKVLVNFEIIMMSYYDVETAFLGMVILVLSILCRRWMISVWTSCGESKTGFALINKFHIGICQFCHMVVDMEVGKVAIIVVDMEVGNVADEVAAIVVKIPNEDFTDSGDGDTFEDNVRGSDQRDVDKG